MKVLLLFLFFFLQFWSPKSLPFERVMKTGEITTRIYEDVTYLIIKFLVYVGDLLSWKILWIYTFFID